MKFDRVGGFLLQTEKSLEQKMIQEIFCYVFKKNVSPVFKILLLGDASFGKSSLLHRFFENFFSNIYIPTIGVDFRNKTFDLDDKIVRLQIWDTPVHQSYLTIMSSYYRGSDGIILVYDTTNKDSFRNIDNRSAQVERHSKASVGKLLLGNKCGLEGSRQVSYEEGKAFADRLGIKFLETSTKNSVNVEQAFLAMAKESKAKVQLTENTDRKEVPIIRGLAQLKDTERSWMLLISRYIGHRN